MSDSLRTSTVSPVRTSLRLLSVDGDDAAEIIWSADLNQTLAKHRFKRLQAAAERNADAERESGSDNVAPV